MISARMTLPVARMTIEMMTRGVGYGDGTLFFQIHSRHSYFFVFFDSKSFSFLEFFDLRPPSFPKTPFYIYIADLHGGVGQNILGG